MLDIAWSSHSARARYLVAIASAALATACNLALPQKSAESHYFLFYAAVLVSALYGGLGPALTVTAVSAVASSYFFLMPLRSFDVNSRPEFERLLLFLLEGSLIGGVGHLLRSRAPLHLYSVSVRYGAALGMVILAVAIKIIAFPVTVRQAPFAFFYAVVVASTWFGGAGPGMLAVVVAAVADRFLFLIAIPSPSDERLMTFVSEATLLCLLTATFRATLVEIRALLRRVFVDSPVGILLVGLDQRIVKANPVVGRDLRRAPASLAGARLVDLCHSASRERVTGALDGLRERKSGSACVEQVLFLRDPEPLWMDVHVSFVSKEAGGDPHFLIVTQDITAHKNAEQALRDSEARLQQAQKMEAIGLLASSIAHDFNNQLAVILGYGEELIRGGRGGDSVRESAEEISKAARKAGTFTRQLLKFSRKDAKSLQPVNLNDVIGDLKTFLCRLLGEHIQLDISLDRTLAYVHCNPSQIEQILMNLVANARDAMRLGGKLIIRTENVALPEPMAVASTRIPAGEYVRLIVADTGHGMDVPTMNRIFEPFYTTKAPDKGTGLGLSTVERVVEQLSGAIGVESIPGQSTTFTVYLPAFRLALEAPRSPAQQSVDRPGAGTVLVVEDEQGLRDLVSKILRGAGYRVLAAGDATEAMALAAVYSGRLDLVLTDLRLPGMQGTDLARKLRKRDADLKVLFVTGDPSEINLTGADALLEKPFGPAELLQKTGEVIRAGRHQGAGK